MLLGFGDQIHGLGLDRLAGLQAGEAERATAIMGQPLWWELFRIQLGIAAKATTSATLWLAASRLSLEEVKLLHGRILQSWTLAPFRKHLDDGVEAVVGLRVILEGSHVAQDLQQILESHHAVFIQIGRA
jgi:hypothetical protein